ncbi:MAG: DUF6069 family protein [Acidimicrobiales bacterium]
MNGTITRTAPSAALSTAPSASPTTSSPSRSLWRTGVRSGLIAAAATVVIAAVASAAGVSFETEPGKSIPALAFGQLTLLGTAVGVFIARTLRRRARQPRSTFTRATVVLTAISCVPDVLLSVPVAAKATLILTHLVAAAIVIPALASRLPERCKESVA